MQRMSGVCSSESHPLYGTFMAKLSHCIFEWDADDYKHLVRAKRGEMVASGMHNPSDVTIKRAITRKALQEENTGDRENNRAH